MLHYFDKIEDYLAGYRGVIVSCHGEVIISESATVLFAIFGTTKKN